MRALVLTTINAPTPPVLEMAEQTRHRGIRFHIAGDRRTPTDFYVPGADYCSLETQRKRFPEFAAQLPEGHYARKNAGYLSAIEDGADIIQETDDDNIPLDSFWNAVESSMRVTALDTTSNWLNVYEAFTTEFIWPRGFPLARVRADRATWSRGPDRNVRGLIRQGLADENPDVDAVFRLLFELPVRFERRPAVMPLPGKWCPFNSQNTVFLEPVFPLLYLPSYCSFRMTDIWRSFVAQRCLWEFGESVVFHQATVTQERNEHNLMRDFEDEIPGYRQNEELVSVLERVKLDPGDCAENLVRCYEALCNAALFPAHELLLVKCWIQTLGRVRPGH